MNYRIFICLLGVLVFCGCHEKDLDGQKPGSQTFTAVIDDEISITKTFLDSECNLLWRKGDSISIFAGSTVNRQYNVSDSSDGKISAALIPVPSSIDFVGSDIDNNVAFYPYQSSATITKSGDNYIIKGIELPSIQTYADESFPMVAITTSRSDKTLKLKNTLGALALQLKGTASIISIKLAGNNNEILCGPANIDVQTGSVPSINLTDASAKTITLDCGGVQLNTLTPTSFVIALPPMTLTNGFTVIITDSEGKQMEIKDEKSRTISRSNILSLPDVNYEGKTAPLTFTAAGETTISLEKRGTPHAISIEYRLNLDDWTAYTIGDIIPLKDKEQVAFRAGPGGNSTFNDSALDSFYKFRITSPGTAAASGNIMSLIDQSMESMTIPCSRCFYKLFYECSLLTSAPELPATTLADECYYMMFYGCRSLTVAPKLPATSLEYYCYGLMFYGCEALTSAPELPAKKLSQYCYRQMFYRCKSLTTAPELPAMELNWECYRGMFSYCESLVVVPKLPATMLYPYCYNSMFSSCFKLTEAPELPATTLSDSCYGGMFLACRSLTSAPKLPATKLQNYCYASMFSECTSLTAAPDLPAETLASHCYDNMFYRCSKLNYIKALFTTPPTSTYTNSYTKNWVHGVSSTGTFVMNKEATWDVTGDSGIPSGWTVKTE